MRIVRDSINIPFEIEVREQGEPLDVSGAATKDIILEKPHSEETVTLAAAFVNTGTDGRIIARSGTDDLDQVGTWRVYAHYVGGSYDLYTPPDSFEVVGRYV